MTYNVIAMPNPSYYPSALMRRGMNGMSTQDMPAFDRGSINAQSRNLAIRVAVRERCIITLRRTCLALGLLDAGRVFPHARG
jgi:hypothetical protein